MAKLSDTLRILEWGCETMIFEDKVMGRLESSLLVDLKELMDDEEYDAADELLEQSIQMLYKAIPDKKRSSYGIVYVVKTLAKEMFKWLEASDWDTYDYALDIYGHMPSFRTITLGLGILSHVGVKDVDRVLPVIEEAACHEVWEVKEFVQMYIRKMTKKNKERMQAFLKALAVSDNPDKRRLASEGLRPVTENSWINQDPDYSLEVLRLLFEESEEFPRTSVGNNLSDLSRKNPELIYKTVEELMTRDNPNSVWIAHRACRNLIKVDKYRVLDLLGVDSYSYKGKTWKR